jgi:cyclopropane fatty-acyl-phospholipid synthase-like methyltransferase
MTSSSFDQRAQDWDKQPYRHERAKAVALQLQAQIAIRPGMTALEFGCGTGLLGFNLIPYFGFVTFADLSEQMLAQVQVKLQEQQIRNADTCLIDIATEILPKSYDCIVSLMTLHHIQEYKATIALLVAHLAPGGFLCIADLDKDDGSFHGSEETAHHGIDRVYLRQIFEQNGLTRIEDSTPYVMKMDRGSGVREYPVFLLTGKK